MIKTKTAFPSASASASASAVPLFDKEPTSQVSFDLKNFFPTLVGDRLFLEMPPSKLYLIGVAQELKDLDFSEHEIDGLLCDFQRKIAVQSMAKALAERME